MKVDEILFIKSELDYVAIVTEKEKLLILDSLNTWEEKMKRYNFIRIHRSYLVNSKRVHKSSYTKLTVGEVEIAVGSAYKDIIADRFSLK